MKAFESILPPFLVVLILVAITLSVLDTTTISRFSELKAAYSVLAASLVGAITLIRALLHSRRRRPSCETALAHSNRSFRFQLDDGRSGHASMEIKHFATSRPNAEYLRV
jgi:hypothetical protein